MVQRADEELELRTGLLGELEVERCLVQNFWHPVRLDTAQMASNADLIAVNRKRRVAIQVKTSTSPRGGHSWLFFGYAASFLRTGKPIFNSKNSPLIADVVIAVSYYSAGSAFVVFPVALAEKLCALHATYWNSVPTKKQAERSAAFPIYLPLNAERKTHPEHYARLRRNVQPYLNAWHILKEDVEKLHDPKRWPLLK